VSGRLPVHVPSAAVSVLPSRGLPSIVGATVLTGAAGLTDAVAETAVALPALLVAVTETRRRRPVSSAVAV
jgi:hypothetical protein